jgi:hypothetical protein
LPLGSRDNGVSSPNLFPSFIGYSDPLNMPYSNPKLLGSLLRKSPTRLSASRVERNAKRFR